MINASVRQLKALTEVARLKSFTRAAQNLHITQQGLSLMIQDLERQVGCRLFDRTTRTVSLTLAGKHLVMAAQQAIASLESAALSIEQISTQLRHTLSIATTPLIAATLMPEACAIFRKQHPNVTVQIADVERNQIQPLVEAGEADVGFGMFLKPTAGLERRQIFQCSMVCVSAAGDMPLTRRTKEIQRLPWSALADKQLIGLPLDNPVQQLVDSHLSLISRGNEQRPTFHNIPTILAMVEAGLGCTILPSFVLAAVRRMKVDIALMDFPVVPMDYFQLNLKGRAHAETEPDFIRALLNIMQKRCTLPN